MNDEQNETAPGYRHNRWEKHLEEIDLEIAQLAVMCRVPLLDPGVIERVLHKDSLVCGKNNPRAFDKLRSLLMMHYSVRDKALVAAESLQHLRPGDPQVAQMLQRLRQPPR